MEAKSVRPKFAYVGGFSSEKRKARGKGVAVYRIDRATGAWTFVEACPAVHNPHWVALDRTQRFLYSAHGDSSETCSYARDPESGRLRFLNKQETGGDNSSTVVADPTNRYAVLANGPGVAVFPIAKDGSLAPRSDLFIPPGGPGPWRDEQEGPHPHQAAFDLSGRWIVVPDKGLDQVHVLRLDTSNGKLTVVSTQNTRHGAIPRHIAFHPSRPYAYIINEMDSTVNTYRWNSDTGELTTFQRIPTTPTTYTGDNTGAEIAVHPSGKFVYASNRGHDSIAIYSVDLSNGVLDHIGWESVQGKDPRFFGLDPAGEYLYAANQASHTIVEFQVDAQSGRLAPTGQIIETGSPSCIAFAD